ncbi:MAG: NBR1-Ig-like domain-containing protein [Chloroflexota bacterium]
MSRSIIGFHYGPGGDDFKRGIGDFMRRLNEKGVPFFMKGADHAGICFEGQDWGEKNGVSNWLVYRTSTEGQKDGNDYDVPDYSKSPEEAAEAHWRITLAKWPKELKPDVVWMEPINEPRAKPDEEKGVFDDMNPVDWLGRFMLAYARIANNANPSFKVCGPSFNSGEPEVFGPNEYELPGMLAYLRYCAANPDQAALSVHEYIWDRWEKEGESWQNWYPELWGRVEAAFAAARKHNIPLDFHVFVTEWGFSYADAPRWPECEPFLKQYDSWAARWPQVKGAAAWSLQGGQFLGAAKDLHTWIGPLTDYILNNDFPRGPQPAEVHDRFGDTTPVTSEPAGPAPPSGLAYEVKGFEVGVEEDHVKPGQSFSPTWTLRNSGSLAWSGDFQFAYVDRTLPRTQKFARAQMAGKASFTLKELTGRERVEPGEKIEISLAMTAPDDPGFRASHWELRNAAGQAFGGTRYLVIRVTTEEQLAEAPVVAPVKPSGPYHYQGPEVTFFTGLHGPADDAAWGRMGFEGMIKDLGLPLVFMSNGVNINFRHMGDPARNVVRLYWSPREATADEAYEEIRDDQLNNWWKQGYRRFIFFNEPQVTKALGQSDEGMGIAWHSADEFARYLSVCLSRARDEFPGIHLYTTPVTSNEALQPWEWRAAIWQHNRRLVDGWCMHAYTGELVDDRKAVNEILNQVKQLQRHFQLQIPIIVSEASVNRGDDADHKARVAHLLEEQAARIPGLEAVFWYAADWDPRFDENNEGWFRKGIGEAYLRQRG